MCLISTSLKYSPKLRVFDSQVDIAPLYKAATYIPHTQESIGFLGIDKTFS